MGENENQYPVGFYFSIALDGTEQGVFQEVSGISNEMNVEEVLGGGENRFKYKLPTTISNKNLLFKRGMFSSESPLLKWCKDTLEGGLSQSIQTKNTTIELMNQNGEVFMSWEFVNAYPVKYLISDLKSQENKVLVEMLEFAYAYFQKETP
ncbi:phage tail protein [uncultured Dokdonia sp.]|uniref:phage tail protein n=1 Tax=uncultured Dokdonia sp. TaxID=575653 RepID=UPI0026175039|nr:phage tail protein [uncultured Dokdonia sp.]